MKLPPSTTLVPSGEMTMDCTDWSSTGTENVFSRLPFVALIAAMRARAVPLTAPNQPPR